MHNAKNRYEDEIDRVVEMKGGKIVTKTTGNNSEYEAIIQKAPPKDKTCTLF